MVGDLGRALLRRRRHNEHGERERAAAAREQPLAGLDHGHEVADAPDGNQDDGRVNARHFVAMWCLDSGLLVLELARIHKDGWRNKKESVPPAVKICVPVRCHHA